MRLSFIYTVILLSVAYASCGQNKNKNKLNPANTSDTFAIPAKPVGWVSDFEKIFSEAQILILDSIIAKHEELTTNEIAIVCCNPDTNVVKNSNDFQKFTLTLLNKWGIGKDDKNNGVGIVFSPLLTKIRIEPGPGLQTKLTTEECRLIIDKTIIPSFKEGNYYEGIYNALFAVIKEIE
jgi:uncharacterized protein